MSIVSDSDLVSEKYVGGRTEKCVLSMSVVRKDSNRIDFLSFFILLKNESRFTHFNV